METAIQVPLTTFRFVSVYQLPSGRSWEGGLRDFWMVRDEQRGWTARCGGAKEDDGWHVLDEGVLSTHHDMAGNIEFLTCSNSMYQNADEPTGMRQCRTSLTEPLRLHRHSPFAGNGRPSPDNESVSTSARLLLLLSYVSSHPRQNSCIETEIVLTRALAIRAASAGLTCDEHRSIYRLNGEDADW